MTLYLNPETREYPRYTGDIQLIKSGWEPTDKLPKPWVEVIVVEPPAVADDETAYEVYPEEINGQWQMKWAVRKLNDDEILFREFLKYKVSKTAAAPTEEPANGDN